MAFAWSPRKWDDLAAFQAYLATIKPPSWLTGITFHNTASPDRAQWQGMTHIKNLGFYYQYQVLNPDGSRGWPSGPHLFLAGDTKDNGIFQGTPLLVPGTHAGPCNSDHLGIEIVGNYNLEPWPRNTAEMVYGVIGALQKWASVPVKEVAAHRECMPGHTDCPGKMINPDAVRAELFRRREGISTPVPIFTRIIGVEQSVTADQFWRSIERNMPLGGHGEATISHTESDWIYAFYRDMNIDAAAVLGMWAHEQGLPYGNSDLGKLTRNPLNMRAPAGDWRWVVNKPGSNPPQPFYAYESWKIGLEYAGLHLKNFYGAYKHLYTLEELLPVFAPTSDGNDPAAYVDAVKRIMSYIKAN